MELIQNTSLKFPCVHCVPRLKRHHKYPSGARLLHLTECDCDILKFVIGLQLIGCIYRNMLCNIQTRTHDKLAMTVFLRSAYALAQLYKVLRGSLPGVCWPLVADALAPIWGQALSSHYTDRIVTTLRHGTIIHNVYCVTVGSLWKRHVHKVEQRKIHKSFTTCSELFYGPVIIVILRLFH